MDTTTLATEVLKLGFQGAVIVGLVVAFMRVAKLYVEVQEKRILESRETITAVNQNTIAMDKLTDAITRNRT